MTDKEIRYRVSVEKDAAKRDLNNFKGAAQQFGAAWQKMRADIKGGVPIGKAFSEFTYGAKNALGSLGGFLGGLGKLSVVLFAVNLAVKAVGAGFAEMDRWVRESIKFETQTFQLRSLTGSLKSARAAMMQLTEGKYAIDFHFGEQAVVDAYKTLHALTDGALASAYMVKLLGDVSVRTGADIGSLAESLGRAWQMIAAGEDMGRLAQTMVRTGMVTQQFMNKLQRMKDAGASAVEIWRELRNEIERTHSGGVESLAGSIEDTRKQASDTLGSIRRELGDMFKPAVAAWEKFKLSLLSGIERVTRNPIRMTLTVTAGNSKAKLIEWLLNKVTGKDFSFADSTRGEMSSDEFRGLSPEKQQEAIKTVRARGNETLAKQYEDLMMAQENRKQIEGKLEELDRAQEEKRDKRKIEGMTGAELLKEAQRTKDPVKARELYYAAEDKLVEEIKKNNDAQKQNTEAINQLKAAQEEKMFEAMLKGMSPEDQVNELLAKQIEMADKAMTYGDNDPRQYEYIAKGMDYKARADEIQSQMYEDSNTKVQRDAETRARNKERKRDLEKQIEDDSLRETEPEAELAIRQKRLKWYRAKLKTTDFNANPDEWLKTRASMRDEESRVNALKKELANKNTKMSLPQKSGVEEYAKDLAREGFLSSNHLSMTPNAMRFRTALTGSPTKSLSQSFSEKMLRGELSTRAISAGLATKSGDEISRMQLQLDNERNRLLREQLKKMGLV